MLLLLALSTTIVRPTLEFTSRRASLHRSAAADPLVHRVEMSADGSSEGMESTDIARARNLLNDLLIDAEPRREQLLRENELMKAVDLKAWLKERGMSHSGKKSVLAARKTECEFQEETLELVSKLTQDQAERTPPVGSLQHAVYKEALRFMGAQFDGVEFSVEEASITEFLLGVVRAAQQIGGLKVSTSEAELEREVRDGFKHAVQELELKQDIENMWYECFGVEARFDESDRESPIDRLQRLRGGNTKATRTAKRNMEDILLSLDISWRGYVYLTTTCHSWLGASMCFSARLWS